MIKTFDLNSNFETKSIDDNGIITIEGYASTAEKDRDGDIILSSAWANGLDNFKKNPIMLYNHNRDAPIGKCTSISIEDDGLKITADIIKEAAGNIYNIIKSGVLSTFSVGFRIKDADYKEEASAFIITDAELFEVSVVTVPANAGATFSVSKSFEESEDFEEFRKQFTKNTDQKQADRDNGEMPETRGKKVMEDENNVDIKSLVAEAVATTLNAQKEADRLEEQTKAAELAKLEAAKKETMDMVNSVAVEVTSGAAKLIEDLKASAAESEKSFAEQIEALKSTIAEKAEEMNAINASKRLYDDRSGGNRDWTKEFSSDIDDAYILGLACKKDWKETKFGKNLVEKANTWSGVEVSSDTFELTVSTNVERDIQLELVLAPMFREVEMKSASMIFPILPDSGYAEWTAAQTAAGTSPHGNLASRGDTYGSPYGGNDLTEKTITTKKLMSQSYLANETEEDAIMPILPLIREGMIRSHARAVEAMILVGNHADGPFGVAGASPNGLIQRADAQALQANQGATGFAAADKITAANLLQCRIGMGKYGVKPQDVVYIVSLDAYFNLLEDPEFQDVNLVGDMATKKNGEVGSIFGSKVMISDEFADKAAAKFFACAVNTRNYFIPRLRGFTIESDNEVANQRRILVMTQRIGFDDVIPTSSTVSSVYGYQYKLA